MEESNDILDHAVESYLKIMDRDDLTDEQREEIEKHVEAMRTRDVIEYSKEHQPKEVVSDQVVIGPPTLTRFEKARIMGARALQLSMGAPPFVEIPDSAKTSLVIANEELDRRVIPIVIKRVLPNGDFQNIPISIFK